MTGLARVPVVLLAVAVGATALATANLTGFGIGSAPFLYDSVALPRLVTALVLITAGWAAWWIQRTRTDEPLRVDAVWGVLAGLAGWAILAMLVSPHRMLAILGQSERLEGVVTVGLYAAAYGLTLQVVRDIRAVRTVLGAFAAAATLLAVYGVAQFAGIEPFDYSLEGYTFETRRAFATLGNPTFLAGLLVLAWPLAAGLALGEKRPRARLAWGFAALLLGTGLFVTFSRGAWLAAVLQVALVAVFAVRSRGGVRWPALRTPLALGAVIILTLAVFSVSAPAEINVLDRVTSAFSGTGSTSERVLLARTAADAVASSPLTGHGPDAFLPAFRLHRIDDYIMTFGAERTVGNAHSWPLQYAATMGIPGAALLVVSIVWALWAAAGRVFRRTEIASGHDSANPASPDLLRPAVWIGCAGFAVHMLTGVAVLGSTIPFWVLLALLGAPAAHCVAVPRAAAFAMPIVAGLFVLLALVGSFAVVRADATYLAARNAFRGLAQGDAFELARQARELNPTSVKYARGAAEAVVVDAEFAAISGAPTSEVSRLTDAAVAELDVVLARHPNDYPALSWRAALLARAGVLLGDSALRDEARSTALRAVALDRPAAEVRALADGDASLEAIGPASAVVPLP